MRLLILLVALVLPSIALAVPLQLAHHGQLLDAQGDPITGQESITFSLWDDLETGNEVWSEVVQVDIVNGHYSTLLNLGELGRDALKAEPSLWLEMEIDGETLEPRQPVAATPYALVADTAENVDGGTVNAQSISVNNNTVIDAAGTWTGGTGSIGWSALGDVPADIDDGDADTLGGLSCVDGDRAVWNGTSGQWECGAAGGGSEAQVLGYIDGAVLDLGVGSTVDSVALATVNDLEWSLLGGVPSGFADEVDDDTLAGMTCQDGQRPRWDALAGLWACVSVEWGEIQDVPSDIADGDSDTVAALSCADEEVAAWNAAANEWICAPRVVRERVYYRDGPSPVYCDQAGDILLAGGCGGAATGSFRMYWSYPVSTGGSGSFTPDSTLGWSCGGESASGWPTHVLCVSLP